MDIKSILETHNVYSVDLELALLRHFEQLRNDILKTPLSEAANRQKQDEVKDGTV